MNISRWINSTLLSKIPKIHLSHISLFAILSSMAFGLVSAGSVRSMRQNKDFIILPPDSTNKKDTTNKKIKMPFPIKDKKPWEISGSKNPFDLNDPPNIKSVYELDKEKNKYNF